MGSIDGKPFDLVQLHGLPESTWCGRAVFHPMAQQGDVPFWDEKDYPEMLDTWEEGDPPKGTAYDVGVVRKWWDDTVHPGIKRVELVTNSGCTLNYAAVDLWTPGGDE